MKNIDLAKVLYEIADILELKNVKWKPIAYRKAAVRIENYGSDICDIAKKGISQLTKIDDIGEGTAKKIIEFCKTGKVKKLEELKKSIPKGMETLLDVRGLGPKKIHALHEKLNVSNISDLKKKITEHRVSKLSGFGSRTEENLNESIKNYELNKKRYLLNFATMTSEEIILVLNNINGVEKVCVAGSLRRGKETIGDIDILVSTRQNKSVTDAFLKYREIKSVLEKGKTKVSVILKSGPQVDIRLIDPSAFGAAEQYFTGNKEHNIKLREIAISKGLKLNEYGLFLGNKLICSKTEKEIYSSLGLKIVPPELRENTIEFNLKRVPKLIELKDIKGDFHIHTNYSDGANTLFSMVKEAEKKGYEYIAITDHSITRAISNGLDAERLKEQHKIIDKINKKSKIRVLKSCEVDILSDGTLDYNDKILKKTDIVVAAVHSGFKNSEKIQTERIIKALENKYVDILAHPTGRLINSRAPYEINLDEVYNAAKKNKVLLEVNSHPTRLDLNDINIHKAIEAGVNLAINTDSHSISDLDNMRYGVITARRGFCTKKTVVNSFSLKDLPKYFKRLEI